MSYFSFAIPALMGISFLLSYALSFADFKRANLFKILSTLCVNIFIFIILAYIKTSIVSKYSVEIIDIVSVESLSKPLFSIGMTQNSIKLFSICLIIHTAISILVGLDCKLNLKSTSFNHCILDLYLSCIYFLVFNESLFGKFVYLEISTILSVALIWKSNAQNNVSGLFYIVTHGISSLGVLIGISGLSYFAIEDASGYGFLMSKVILQAGLLIGIGLLPFAYFVINAYVKAKKMSIGIVVACYSKMVSVLIVEVGFVYEYNIITSYFVFFTAIYCLLYALLEKDFMTSFFYQSFGSLFIFIFYFFHNPVELINTVLIDYFANEMLHSVLVYMILFSIYNTSKLLKISSRNVKNLSTKSSLYFFYIVLLMFPFIQDINLVNEHRLHHFSEFNLNVNLALLIRNMFSVFWCVKLFALMFSKFKSIKYAQIEKDMTFYLITVFVLVFLSFSVVSNVRFLDVAVLISTAKIVSIFLMLSVLLLKPLVNSSRNRLFHVHHVYLRVIMPMVLGTLKALSFINYAFVEYFYRTRKTVKSYIDVFLFKNHFTQDNALLNIILIFAISVLIILATQYHQVL